MSVIYAFVKIFENKDHALDLLQGKLFMNTIGSFRKYKDKNNELRGDKYEGIEALLQPNKIGEINFSDIEINPNDLTEPIIIYNNDLLDKNVFCIYSLNSGGFDTVTEATLDEFKRTIELHESCYGLGTHCVIIHNATEFIDRCKSAINKLKISGNLGLVEYYDQNSFHGNMPIKKLGFQKRNIYKYQREYRIKIDLNKDHPCLYKLDIGNIQDIAILSTPKEFKENLNLKLPNTN